MSGKPKAPLCRTTTLPYPLTPATRVRVFNGEGDSVMESTLARLEFEADAIAALAETGMHRAGDCGVSCWCDYHGCWADHCAGDLRACEAMAEDQEEDNEAEWRDQKAYERAHSAWRVSR